MEFKVGQVIKMKKKHPCGENRRSEEHTSELQSQR